MEIAIEGEEEKRYKYVKHKRNEYSLSSESWMRDACLPFGDSMKISLINSLCFFYAAFAFLSSLSLKDYKITNRYFTYYRWNI